MCVFYTLLHQINADFTRKNEFWVDFGHTNPYYLLNFEFYQLNRPVYSNIADILKDNFTFGINPCNKAENVKL